MRFENQVFDNTTVTLDGNEFVKCKLRNCRVRFNGGKFTLVETSIENPTFVVAGRAAYTITFMRMFHEAFPQQIDMLLDPAHAPILSEVG